MLLGEGNSPPPSACCWQSGVATVSGGGDGDVLWADSTVVLQHHGLPRNLCENTPGKKPNGSISGFSGEAGLLDSEVKVFFVPLVTPALQPEAMLPSLPPLGSHPWVPIYRTLAVSLLAHGVPQRPLLLWQS